MQSSSCSDGLNDIKTQLITREGIYRLIPGAEYCRPKASTYGPIQTTLNSCNNTAAPVRLSFTKTLVTDAQTNCDRYTQSMATAQPKQRYNYETTTSVNTSSSLQRTARHSVHNSLSSSHSSPSNRASNHDDNDQIIEERICFNVGREIYIYTFNGLQNADSTKLVDRRTYKATAPTAHDFSNYSDPSVSLLLIGFNAGQIQLIDLHNVIDTKFFNQERLIEKSKVTCIRWLPKSRNQFLVSYSSGHMLLFREDLLCGTGAPHYALHMSGPGYSISTQKNKTSRNPIYKWSIGNFGAAGGYAINEFCFSPCGVYLAIVSQDGFLRVFHYEKMELVGTMRSYFGGLLCVAWSPDSLFIATGGEDDLITFWSMADQCVVARGQGHKSWVNVVQFDPFVPRFGRGIHDDDEHDKRVPSFYRLCSAGQDTQICLWDLTDDIIKLARASLPCRMNGTHYTTDTNNTNSSLSLNEPLKSVPNSVQQSGSHNKFFNSLIKNKKSAEAKLSKGHTKPPDKKGVQSSAGILTDKFDNRSSRDLGSSYCPKLNKVPMLEPHLCKKVSNERLTALAFRSDYFVIANQDGKISLFSRPKTLDDRFPSGTASITSDVMLMATDDMTICDDDNSDAM